MVTFGFTVRIRPDLDYSPTSELDRPSVNQFCTDDVHRPTIDPRFGSLGGVPMRRDCERFGFGVSLDLGSWMS